MGSKNRGAPENKILIVSIIPQFLERGALWFKENEEKIRQAIKTQSFWRNNALFIEKGEEIKMGVFLRRLAELGYEKTNFLFGRGEFSQRGNIIDIWPINLENSARIEFFGNKIEDISTLESNLPKDEKRKTKAHENIKNLKNGDYVVHIDHGIGIFREILKEKDKEFFVLEYAPPKDGSEHDRLLVPTTLEKRLSLYIGFDTPKIHRLGGSFWSVTKKKIREDAEKFARELLQLYSNREISRRPPYISDETMEKDFASYFEFIETEDQLKAWEDIKKDMSQDKPMDRLICGDVGFGKTEIAMRTIFRVVVSGRKAFLIAPTTILAHEHFNSFKKRFERFPVEIACLSRLTPPKETKEIIKKVNEGKIDILIGTHRLLSSDVLSKQNPPDQNLKFGLIVVDDEQRFGVKQKEKFKETRSSIDILSLSATPIPRTLYLSLAKLRDVSLLRTPPLGRLAVKNFILPFSPKTIREAVKNELSRDGQIYILHNRTETMGVFTEKLKRILKPLKAGCSLGIMHGGLPKTEIIKTLDEFRTKKINILVATTIIENGLDFSNVNTLIVDDGSRLGLSQAYQIRGRVGRGDQQAYAYFLSPVRSLARDKVASPVRGREGSQRASASNGTSPEDLGEATSNEASKPRSLTEKAFARLEALKNFEELGSGYDIALRDLEIRGGGNILGKEQSGSINAVGLNLYCQMLSEAIENLRTDN